MRAWPMKNLKVKIPSGGISWKNLRSQRASSKSKSSYQLRKNDRRMEFTNYLYLMLREVALALEKSSI
jgi:hypothetical protein